MTSALFLPESAASFCANLLRAAESPTPAAGTTFIRACEWFEALPETTVIAVAVVLLVIVQIVDDVRRWWWSR